MPPRSSGFSNNGISLDLVELENLELLLKNKAKGCLRVFYFDVPHKEFVMVFETDYDKNDEFACA